MSVESATTFTLGTGMVIAAKTQIASPVLTITPNAKESQKAQSRS